MQTIAVIGAGTMGSGIAQLFIEHGFTTYLWDMDSASIQKGVEAIFGRISRSVAKNSMSEEQAKSCRKLLKPIAKLDELAGADLVLEAISESLDAKTKLYQQLEQVLSRQAVIASNTSSLSITALAATMQHQERFLGLHFFNPPTKLALVEVITTENFPAAILEKVLDVLQRCQKQPVLVKDAPGFIVNRLLLPLINEAARLVDAGVASPEDIDTAMRLGALHPAGPLQVADLIGLDICCHILDSLAESLDNPVYRPAPALRDRVAAGKLGRKSGAGFYTY